jgi:hypothetical protein
MTRLWLGLILAFAFAIAVNWAHSRDHDTAATMLRFSSRRPRQFVSLRSTLRAVEGRY